MAQTWDGAERLTIDPSAESSANAPLELVGLDVNPSGIYLMEHDYPTPELDQLTAESADTEGAALVQNRDTNRQLTARVRVNEPTDPASTNLCTNPKAAIDAANWTNTGLVSLARAALPVGLPPAGADFGLHMVGDADGDYGWTGIPLTTGHTFRFSSWVYLAANTATGVRLVAYNATPTKKFIGTTLSTLGAFIRLDISVPADSTATWRLGVEQVGAGATDFYVSGVMPEESASLTAFFDGDWPGCSWVGANNASTSTRPAPGGPRFYAILDDIQQMTDRVKRDKDGTHTLRRFPPNGAQGGTFDLISARISDAPQDRRMMQRRAEMELTFDAKPFARRPEKQIGGTYSETVLPAAIVELAAVGGDAPALGRLVINEAQAVDQFFLMWGLQNRRYDPAASAALFFEAEGRTLSSGMVTAARAGASGGNVARQTALLPYALPQVSLQATGGGSQPTHIGTYEVWARVFDPNYPVGLIQMYLQWAVGDFSSITTNDTVSPPVILDYSLVNLGQVRIPQGSAQWQGQVWASSTVNGADIDIDCFFLRPLDEGAGIARALVQPASVSITEHDEFEQAAGALAGKTAPLGGNWAGAGDADDFTATGAPLLLCQRTATLDGGALNNGRVAFLPVVYTEQFAQVDVYRTVNPSLYDQGIVLRYVDINNFFFVQVSGNGNMSAYKCVGGVSTGLVGATVTVPTGFWKTIEVYIDAAGHFYVWYYSPGSPPGVPILAGSDATLATAGTLASGKSGVIDHYPGAVAHYGFHDNFWAGTIVGAKGFAPLPASRSAEIRSDRALRQDAAGAFQVPMNRYEGDYFLIPAGGREGRKSRIFVKGSRGDPGTASSDPAIDDINYQVYAQERVLVI